MKKTVLLGSINVALVCWFSFILATSPYSLDPFVSFYSVVKAYASLLIIFLLSCMNGYLAYVLLIKKPKAISYPVITTLTFAPLFWFVFAFIGFFFTSHLVFLLVALLSSFALYFYFKKHSHRVALFLSLGTIFVMSVVLLSNFEEDYCWKQGDIADPSGTKSISASREDANKLNGMGVIKGQEIGVAFRSHMLCHTTFDLKQAILKSYF